MHQQPDLSTMEPGKQFVVFGHFFNFLATVEESGGRYSIFEDRVPPGAGPPMHTHPDEELFYIIDGDFEFTIGVGGPPQKAGPGQLVRIPSMAAHTFRNVSSVMAKTLTIFLPGDMENYFRAIGSPVTEQSHIPDLSQTPDYPNMDVSKAFALAAEHNVVFTPPAEEPAV